MAVPTSEVCDTIKDTSFGVKLLQQLKENRIEAMVITILLYSTGILEKAYLYGSGVCV